MRYRVHVRAVSIAAAVLLSACEGPVAPTTSAPSDPAAAIVDAARGGSAGFYFLPPLVRRPVVDGVFDGTLAPVVEVCELVAGACAGPTIVTFTTDSDQPGERIRVVGVRPGHRHGDEDRGEGHEGDDDDEGDDDGAFALGPHYRVLWRTRAFDLTAGSVYRVTVRVAGVELGFADVLVVTSWRDRMGVDRNEFVTLRNGRTLPIRFRIEEGAVDAARGGRIVFHSDRDGSTEIYSMFADGSDVQQLTATGATNLAPRWSPDGRRILFVSNLSGGTRDIHVMDADGSDVFRVFDAATGTDVSGWSPDGQTIAFPQGDGDLYKVGIDGTGLHQLTFIGAGEGHPSWTPDGLRIVYQSQQFGANNEEIVVMDADGANPMRITDSPGGDIHPSVSPDGTRIAFSSPRAGGPNDLFVMAIDGSDIRAVTRDPNVGDFEPAWSPDGTKLAFQRRLADGTQDIYVIGVDGTGLRRLTDVAVTDGANNASPSWR